MAVYEALLLNTVVPQIQAAQAGDSYVMVVNATTPALRITQTGTGNALVVEDSANPDSTPFVVTAAGDVGIGTTTPLAKLHVAGEARFVSGATTQPAITITQGFINADISSANFTIGNFGDNSSEMRVATRGFTTFFTGATDNNTGTERARITSGGDLLVGTQTSNLATASRGVIELNGASTAYYGLDTGGTLRGAFYTNGSIIGISSATLPITFGTTGGTEWGRFTSGGDLQIANGNLVMSTSGKGIDFSATSSGTGTMTSELLNDYEEGTWTPNYAGSTGSAGSYAVSDNSGWYTKVGNMVTVWWRLILTNKGSWTGDIEITGLPFTVANPSGTFDGANAIGVSKLTFSGYVYTEPRRNTTYISVLNVTSGSDVAILATTTVSNDSAFLGQATYFV